LVKCFLPMLMPMICTCSAIFIDLCSLLLNVLTS
jgi:hypothetical protein